MTVKGKEGPYLKRAKKVKIIHKGMKTMAATLVQGEDQRVEGYALFPKRSST